MRKTSAIVIGVTFGALVLFDIIVYLQSGSNATISIIMRDWGCQIMTFTFLAGFIFGHMFWPQRPKKRDPHVLTASDIVKRVK